MPRLPIPGSDNNAWGTILNEFLEVAHNSDGTLQGGQHTTATFSFPGVVAITTGVGRFIMPGSGTIVGVVCSAATAPTGQALICDIHKNGATIYSTQGNRPQIAAGANASAALAVPDVTSFVLLDYFTVDIDQIGSGAAGSDVVLNLMYALA